MEDNPENKPDSERQELPPPTEQELVAMIENCGLPEKYRLELAEQRKFDPWIDRQLLKLYHKVSEVYDREDKDDLQVKLLWEALWDDWEKRRQNTPKNTPEV